MNSFWEGFEKRADYKSHIAEIAEGALKAIDPKLKRVILDKALRTPRSAPLFRRPFKNKNIVIVGSRQTPENVITDKLRLLASKNRPIAVSITKKLFPNQPIKEVMRDAMKNLHPGGTLVKGKKRTKFYISRASITSPKDKGRLRELIHHEMFHGNAPMGLGGSEILAHIYGGLKRTKGKRYDIKGAAKSLDHLMEARPGRLKVEMAGTLLAAHAAKKGIGAIRKAVSKEPPYPSWKTTAKVTGGAGILGGAGGYGLHKLRDKSASQDPISEWETESVEADKKAKNKKEPGPDLTTMLHGFPPDTYWRSWP